MTLRQKQSEFALDVADLILWAHHNGYEVTLSEAYRPPEVARMYANQGRGRFPLAAGSDQDNLITRHTLKLINPGQYPIRGIKIA